MGLEPNALIVIEALPKMFWFNPTKPLAINGVGRTTFLPNVNVSRVVVPRVMLLPVTVMLLFCPVVARVPLNPGTALPSLLAGTLTAPPVPGRPRLAPPRPAAAPPGCVPPLPPAPTRPGSPLNANVAPSMPPAPPPLKPPPDPPPPKLPAANGEPPPPPPKLNP